MYMTEQGYPAAVAYVTGRVVDANTKEGLPQASVVIVTKEGKNLGIGVTADSEGYFQFTSNLITGNLLLISYGNNSTLVDPADLYFYNVIELDASDTEAPVVVTPPKRSWLWLLLIGGVAAIAISKK